MRKTNLAWIVLTACIATGCRFDFKKKRDLDKDREEHPDSEVITNAGNGEAADLNLAFRKYEGCDALKADLKAKRLRVLRDQLESQAYWLDYHQRNIAAQSSASKSSKTASADTAGSATPSAGPNDFTTTNNQVSGVEEGDFVKNDGKTIYHLSHSKLRILQGWPAHELKLMKEIEFPNERPTKLILSENKRLIVVSQILQKFNQVSYHGDAKVAIPDGGAFSYLASSGKMRVRVLDVAEPANPKELKVFRFHGELHEIRRVGASLRMVMHAHDRGIPGLKGFLPFHSEDYDGEGRFVVKRDLRKEIEDAMAENSAVLDQASVRDLLVGRMEPSGANQGGVEGDPVADLANEAMIETNWETCDKVYLPQFSTNFGMTKVVGIDLATMGATESVLGTYTQTIYGSEKSLYLTTPVWFGKVEANETSGTDKSYIHKFDFVTAMEPVYQRSVSLPGMVKDQFSIDEFEGHLRIATTITEYSRPDDHVDQPLWRWWWGRQTTKSQLFVLKADGADFGLVGQTPAMAPGERIYSVRFMGKKGFIVTFRQVDPLFAIDLSVPASPTIVGELKIPGFSNYMQPIDDNTLLTIGYDADATNGRSMGQQLSIFDISDLKAPKRTFVQGVMPDGMYSHSEAQYNHLAFTYFKSKGLLAIPVSYYERNNSNDYFGQHQSVLKVFKIDKAAGISVLGAVNVGDLAAPRRNWNYWYDLAQVQRSIFADDYVYAISNAGVKIRNVNDLTVDVAKVNYNVKEDGSNE